MTAKDTSIEVMEKRTIFNIGRLFTGDLPFQILTVVAILACWEIGARVFNSEFFTSRPLAIVTALQAWWNSGRFFTDLQMTLAAAAGGFVIGSVVGGFVGFVFGWVRKLGNLFEPLILSLYTLPKIALAPLFVLWFGIGLTNKIMFSSLLVFFIVFFTTFQGTRQVDQDLVQNARVLGAGRWDVWTKIAIPYAAVWVFTGIRLGLPYALIGAIVGEFVASDRGIGYRIKEATSFFDTASVFAALFVLMLISGSLLAMMRLVESYVLRWQSNKGAIGADVDSP